MAENREVMAEEGQVQGIEFNGVIPTEYVSYSKIEDRKARQRRNYFKTLVRQKDNINLFSSRVLMNVQQREKETKSGKQFMRNERKIMTERLNFLLAKNDQNDASTKPEVESLLRRFRLDDLDHFIKPLKPVDMNKLYTLETELLHYKPEAPMDPIKYSIEEYRKELKRIHFNRRE
ncbi:unnamed protein product [Bursaphelenchus okinawaensis]|uniref:Uncharacterized protein n=1 Tax=Bursaphelenchus okinawaensis TaxID=465554 RepID=A0A811L7A9_9BILA|nr:unnamed protein product [Bursaphelenchus okinawaensis]CAG9118185.1 unnamed protein product [Bursaphelenchus okinawaensis]